MGFHNLSARLLRDYRGRRHEHRGKKAEYDGHEQNFQSGESVSVFISATIFSIGGKIINTFIWPAPLQCKLLTKRAAHNSCNAQKCG